MKRHDIEQRIAECYSTWGTSYYEEYYGAAAKYPPVHLDLVRQVVEKHKPLALLDAGCGPASMLRGLNEVVPERFGFDLTPEMIAEAKMVFRDQEDDARRIWKGSVLQARSFVSARSKLFFPYPMILCIGVLPHISEADDVRVFKNLYKSLEPGGVAVVEARNQLFSLFTLNRYTHEFLCDQLIKVASSSKRSPRLAKAMNRVKKEMRGALRMDLPPIRKGARGEPGYDEVLSRLHNPLVVAEQLRAIGFSEVDFLFYHYHCVPPQFHDLLGDDFMEESLSMEQGKDWRGYFMASAFLAIATR